MKHASPKFRVQRTLVLGLISFVVVAGLLALAASAKRTRQAASLSTNIASPPTANSVPDPALTAAQGKKPLAPQAASIVATLTDNVTAATKIAPGGTINYTATITNNGAVVGTDDATNLNFSAPLDANTTLVPNSVHASPIARNDTYNWIGNTFLDTAARTLPAVTANDVAVNAPGGTDTFTLTAIAGGATTLGGTVTLASPSGAFTYTPPLNRPNLADGAAVNDSFTYTITNSADPSLTSTGTVTITLTGRVFYLQAGAAGDGRSGTPSGNPGTMSTNADKSSDIFYIFSNAGSLSGLFTVDAGQQLLGQGVALVINIPVLGSTTLFPASTTPATTNGAGNCVTLAGAPGNNTLSGFNIGNCTGGTAAIVGSNVGTLSVSTVSINTNVGAVDLTGVSTPTVSVVLGGTTSTGGAKNVNLVGLNGTITLASGALSGATGNSFDVNGGNAAITYSGTISNSGAKQVNIANKSGGSVTLDGAVSGSGTGINLVTNPGATITFRGGVVLSTGANPAFTATGPGPLATSGGTVNVCDENPCVPGATGALVNTLTTTTATALNVANTTIGANNLEFRSVNSPTASANSGIVLNNTGTSGGLKVVGTGSGNTGGTISNKTISGISATSTANLNLSFMSITGNGDAIDENGIRAINLTGTSSLTSLTVTNSFHANVWLQSTSASSILTMTVSNSTFNSSTTHDGFHQDVDLGSMTLTMSNCNFNSNFSDGFDGGIASNSSTVATLSDISLTTSSFNNNGANGILIFGSGSGDSHFNIFSNTSISGNPSLGINIFQNNQTTSSEKLRGKINANTITYSTVNGGGQGLLVNAQGAGTATVEVTNNTVNYNRGANTGITIQSGDGGPGSTIVKFTGNTINMAGIDFPLRAINIESGLTAASTRTICLNAGVVGAGDDSLVNLDAAAVTNGVERLRVRKKLNSFFQIQGLSPSPNTNATSIQNFLKSVTGLADPVIVQPASGSPAFWDVNYSAGSCDTSTSIPQLEQSGSVIDPQLPEAIDKNVARNRSAVAPSTGAPAPVAVTPVAQISFKDDLATILAKTTRKATAAEAARIYQSDRPISHHAVRRNLDGSAQQPNAPTSGETVTLNTIATFPAGGKSITIKYSATVNAPPLARQVSTQGTVTANAGAISVLTDDPEPAGGPQATVTVVDTLMTWNGATSTDWNTATNWTQPAGGTQYAPGVSNPAVNDVVIPNVGAQPNISVSDIGVFSLNISNGRTLTITSPRVLTIGGSPGGDLTLDGIISGGNLNLGTGTHVINNAGGTGTLSSTNVATVLSGGTVTLNNNLQAGALAVNAGGSMNITNRTLSLNGSGAALVVPGGATFTTTTSTVIFNGTAAQQAAGIAYNNLTINNTIGTNVTGVTLTGNASVGGTLALTSSDLDTGAFTLTQPNTTASTGVSDVVGTVSRTGGPFALATPLTFGNPSNILTITAGATRPTTVTMGIAKAAPVNPNGYAAAVQRSYTISQTGGTGFTSTLRLHYLDGELNGNTEASLNLRRLRTSDNHWTVHLPTTLDGANNWVQSTTVLDTELSTRWTMSSLAPTASNGMVTGRITDAQGRPVEGAVVRLSGVQERKFITDANGNYRFDDVETGGFYTVTPARANYHFNPFNRSFSQTGNQTQAVFTAESMGDNANPLDTAEYFVRQQYVDVLSREPEEAGFNYWSDKILACGEDVQCVNTQRRQVAAAFFIAEENQASGVFIYDAYAGALGRRPAFAEFTVERTHVVGGATLDADKTAFAQSFVQRAEFVTKYQNASSADAFVDALLQSVRGTGADLSSERTNLIDIYGQGADQVSSRAAVLRSIADNAVFKQSQYNPAFVLTEYFAYLRRDAEPDGFNFWVGVLNTGDAGNYRGMVCSFVTSREYQNRFSQIVSHSNGECSGQ